VIVRGGKQLWWQPCSSQLRPQACGASSSCPQGAGGDASARAALRSARSGRCAPHVHVPSLRRRRARRRAAAAAAAAAAATASLFASRSVSHSRPEVEDHSQPAGLAGGRPRLLAAGWIGSSYAGTCGTAAARTSCAQLPACRHAGVPAILRRLAVSLGAACTHSAQHAAELFCRRRRPLR
jgi:hypothetical protein